MSSSGGSDFGSTPDSFDNAANSISTAAIVSIIVSVIATIAIVVAIIYCLKKTGDSLPKYAQAQFTVGGNNSRDQNNYNYNHQVEAPYVPKATMERFLSDMAREKPTRFSSHELAQCTHNFSKVLGSGGFGVVYKGEFPNGIHVAVKVLKENISKKIEEQFMAEVSTMGRTYHINLVRLYGFCFDPTMRALVYEYMEQGSADKLLFHQQNNTSITLETLQDIAIGTARGIAYLHEECEQRIIHYDIKPENVLLDARLNPKVADFGLAKLCNRDNTHVVMSGCRGTPGYAAPELWTPYPVTHKCDVYSFGMLLFEIVGRRRNHDINLSGSSQEWLPMWAYEKFDKGELDEMLSLVGVQDEDKEKADRMVKVALWCVQYLPNSRPMMSSVVKMLEGGVEIDSPPNPFAHLQDNYLGLISSGGISSSNANSISSGSRSDSPLVRSENNKAEIQIASTNS